MIMLIIMMIAAAALFAIYLRLKPRTAQVGPFLPDWYLLGISIYATGCCYLTFFDNRLYSQEVTVIALLALISALLGAITFLLLQRTQYKNVDYREHLKHSTAGPYENGAIYLGILFSSLISLLFIYFVFSNSIIGALLSIASVTGDSTLLVARKAITSGSEGYFAPGYIKQFRDILIPIFLIAIMFTHANTRMSLTTKLIFLVSLGSAVLAMLVSGQRLVIIILLVTLFMGRHYYAKIRLQRDPQKKNKRTGQLVLISALLLFYGGSTILLGRVTEDASLSESILGLAGGFFERVFLASPSENMTTYRFWGAIGPTMGDSWVGELGTILPGMKGFSLANQLHSLMGGSEEGNSPLGLPVDVWFAWGWTGVLIIPFFYAIFWGFLDMVLMSERSPLFGALKIYLALAAPIMMSPYGFILYGGAVAVILILWVKGLRHVRRRGLWRTRLVR